MVTWGEEGIEGGPSRAFSPNAKLIKLILEHELDLKTTDEKEKGALALEKFLMPTPFSPVPLGNIIPDKRGKALNVKDLEYWEGRYFMPGTPHPEKFDPLLNFFFNRGGIRLETLDAAREFLSKEKSK